MIILVMAAAVLGLGLVFRLPGHGIAAMLGALWAAGLMVHLVFPVGHPLVRAVGGSWRHWLGFAVLAALVIGYRWGLQSLRARAVVVAPPSGTFSGAELERYARHIVLREIGGAGQKRLKGARVLVVGAGGLGSPVLLYLAAAGVGRIGVIDDDIVSNSNLQRQIIHTDARIGMAKVASAKAAMLALNPFVEVEALERRLGAEEAAGLFARYDVILDGTDNFATRYMVNAAAVAAGRPLISGAITQWEGQVGLFDPARGGPCYACVFPEEPAAGLAPSCAEAGVVAPLPGVIGAMMALEAVKFVTGAGAGLRGALVIYDGLWGETRRMGVTRRAGCAVCGGLASAGPLDSGLGAQA